MSRPQRIVVPGGRYHVFNRGADHRSIFLTDGDRIEFGRLLGEAFERFGLRTMAYCLMGNHYHLLLHCPEAGLSESMQRIGSVYTRHFNERHGRDGPLFRGRFASIPIEDDQYLLTAFRYIHRNALDVGGVDDVCEYRWSSHRTYLGLRPSPPFLATDEILAYFGGDRARLHRFVAGDTRSRTDSPRSTEITSLVALAVAESTQGDRSRPQPWLNRVAALALLRYLPAETAEKLQVALGSPSARSVRRATARADDDQQVAEIVNRVLAHLGPRRQSVSDTL